MANKRFTTIKNDYSITFGADAEIQRAENDTDIKLPGYDFSKICDISKLENGRVVDVIGVVCEVSEVETIRLRSGGEKEKRMIQIADNSEESGCCIKVCFWGVQAKDINFVIGDVVAFRSLKITEFSGRSLNACQETAYKIKPDCKETKKLEKWYKDGKSLADMRALTQDRNDLEKRSNESVRLISELNQS